MLNAIIWIRTTLRYLWLTKAGFASLYWLVYDEHGREIPVHAEVYQKYVRSAAYAGLLEYYTKKTSSWRMFRRHNAIDSESQDLCDQDYDF
jgi:hypothetical protein